MGELQLKRLMVVIGSNVKGLSTGIKKGSQELAAFDKKVVAFQQGFTVAAAATIAATVAVGEFAVAGGKSLNISAAFTRRVGDQAAALGILQRATKGLVTDQELMRQANVAFTLGSATSVRGMAEMAEVAQVLGRSLGLDTAFALNSLNIGIARQSRLVLDNVGLLVSATEANKNYAAANGLVASQLTQVQQKEAFRVETMVQARQKIADLGGTVLNAGDAWTSFKVSMTNAIGEMQAAAAKSGVLQSAFEGMRDSLREGGGGTSGVVQAIIDSLAEITDRGVLLDRADEFLALDDAVANGTDSIDELQARFVELGITGVGLEQIIRALAGQFAMLKREADLAAEAAAEARRQAAPGARLAAFEAAGAFRPRVMTGQFQAGLPVDPAKFRAGQIGSDEFMKALVASVNKIAANLKPLTTKPGAGQLPGRLDFLKDQARDLLNPERIASQVAATAISGGLSAAFGLGSQALASFFKGGTADAVVEANTAALRENTEQIISSIRGTAGRQLTGFASAFRNASEAALTGGDRIAVLTSELDRLNLTWQDAVALARSFGLELTTDLRTWQQFQDALSQNVFASLGGRQNLAQRRIDFGDVTDPREQFRIFQEALAGSLPAGLLGAGGLGMDISRLDPSTIGAFAQGVLDQIAADPAAFAAMLGDVSIDEFLAAIGQLETLGDAAGDAAGALSGIAQVVNQPSGFKLALRRFNATFATDERVRTFSGGAGARAGVTVEDGAVRITVDGADPAAGARIWQQLKRAMELDQARAGGDELTLGTQLR